MSSKTIPCKAILCDNPTRFGWCRQHSHCERSEAFGEALKAVLETIPAAQRVKSLWDADGRGWEFELASRIGRLRVEFVRDSYGVYCQFEDAKAAAHLLNGWIDDVNPRSGKWNHHFPENRPVDAAIFHVIEQLRRVL